MKARCCLFLALAVFMGCASEKPKSIAAYLELGTLGLYLDFPNSPEKLAGCRKANDTKCLAMFDRAKSAAQTVLAGDRAHALQRILAAIASECGRPVHGDPNEGLSPWLRCRGAVASLYFFSSPQEDSLILDRFRTLNDVTKWNIFVESKSATGDWVGNRPAPEEWSKWVATLVVLDKAPIGRKGFQALFQTTSTPSTGIALLAHPQ